MRHVAYILFKMATLSIRNKENKILVTVTFFLIWTDICGSFQMNDYCGKELSFITKGVYQMKLYLDDVYMFDKYDYHTCETTLEAWYTFPKFMFYFEDLDLDCDAGHLEFYEGESGSSRVRDLRNDVCGNSKPSGVFVVDAQYLRIKYVPKKRQYTTDIFRIIITAYTDGYCPSYAFECKNSRCIDEDVACNEYDSCGDGSGCDLSTGAIVGIAIGSVAGVALIVSVIICCVCCTRRSGHRPGVVQNPTQTQVMYSTPSQQGYSQPSYGFNQGTPYPNYQTQGLSSSSSTTQAPYPANQTQGLSSSSSTSQAPYPDMSTNVEPTAPELDSSEPPTYNELFGTS